MVDELPDYLTDEIANFDVFNRPLEELLELLNFLWWPEGSNEWTPNANGIIIVATGGWSDNEFLIRALQKNIAFWSLYWHSSYRGGQYVFVIKNMENEAASAPEQVQKLARNTLDSQQMRTLFYGLREGWPMPLLEWIADSVIDGGETTGHGMHYECVVDTIDLLFDEGWIRTEEERESAQTRD